MLKKLYPMKTIDMFKEEELWGLTVPGTKFQALKNSFLFQNIIGHYLTRFKDEARELMDGFKWGHTFLELNHDLLEAYSEVDSSAEVVKIQNEFLSES